MNNLVFVDTETTGTDINSKVIQLAYIQDDTEVDVLFNPWIPIPYTAMAIHHITDEQVSSAPRFIDSPYPDILQDILDRWCIFVAHNAIFDIAMLQWEWMKINKYICTMKLAQYLNIEWKISVDSVWQQYLRYFFWCKFTREINPHNALDDIIVLKAIFEKLQGYFESIDEMVEISMKPLMLKTIWFWKYKWRDFTEILQVDRRYLERLYNNISTEWDPRWKDQDIYYTIHNLLYE